MSFSFDATQVAPAASSDPIPAGNYAAMITESEIKPLKSGNGTALRLTFQILDGEFKNRKVWANLNIQHTNTTAQAIAQQQLSAICHAVNVLKISNPAALHNKPMTIKVKVRPAHDGYDASNDISGYSAINAASAAPTAATNGTATARTAASAAPATPATKSAPPWAAKKPAAPAPEPTSIGGFDDIDDQIPF